MKIKTPELDKINAVHGESQAIGNFLAWLQENGMFVASYIKVQGYRDEQAFPVSDNTEKLLARYFGIDLDKAERERVRILDACREANSRRADRTEGR
jgi:hypothetical protein